MAFLKHFRSPPLAVSVHTLQSPIYTTSSPSLSHFPSCYWFYDGCPTPVNVLENSRIFDVPNRICLNTGKEFFKPHKTRTVLGIPERTGSLFSEQADIKITILKFIMLKELQSRELHVVMFHVMQVYRLRALRENTQLRKLFR